MKRFVGWRALVAAPLLALLCVGISASSAGAAAPTGTRVVAPKPVLPHGAKQLGAVSASATVSGAVVLQPRDESGLKNFISQVTDRHSALFHQYLTPTTFAAKFGPTPASIAAVEAELRSEGLAVTNVSRSGLLIDFKGAADKVETTFGTGLSRYKLANGSVGRARTGAIRVPASIAKYVTSVVGLDNTVKAHAEGLRPSKTAAGNHAAAKRANFVHPANSATPCSDASSIAEAFGGLTDDQIAHAYGADPLYSAGDTGAGQHVAIFELEPFLTSDVQTFDTCYFGASAAGQMLSRLHVRNVDGGQTAGSGEGEAILDIQDVSAFAPGASIDVYEAPNTTFGSLDEYAQIVNDDQDQVVTSSWGLCEQAVQQGEPGVQQAENLIFEQAAAQGQTVFSAAGDEGSNDCNAFETTSPVDPVLSVDDPSSQPYVVAAGGTTMDDATQPASEHVWNDGAAWGAGGGGISESWPMPAWQAAPQVPGGVGSTANQNQVNDAENFMGTAATSRTPAGRCRTSAPMPTSSRVPSPSTSRPSAAGRRSAAPRRPRRCGPACSPTSTRRRRARPTPRPRPASASSTRCSTRWRRTRPRMRRRSTTSPRATTTSTGPRASSRPNPATTWPPASGLPSWRRRAAAPAWRTISAARHPP
jgi:subtilase family serine protease